MSFLLVATLVCVFPLSPFAATKAIESENKPDAATSLDESTGIQSGMLSGSGAITINGIPSSSGTTVMNGNVITTGSDGNASIELYGLGRIVLTPNTTARLDMSRNQIQVAFSGKGKLIQSIPAGISGQVKFAGDTTNLNVIRGELSAESASGSQTIKAGQNVNIASLNATVSKGDTLFEAESSSEAPPVPQAGGSSFLGHGLTTVLIVAVIATPIIVGVIVRNNRDNDIIVSGIR